MIVQGQEKPSLEELALEHFGVKGMKWGVIRKRLDQRKKLRGMDKANRAADRAERKAQWRKETSERDAAIDAARMRVATSNRKDLKNAKARYKVDKKKIGKYAAKKKLNAVKLRNMNDEDMAKNIKSGAETVGALIGLVGTMAIGSVVVKGAYR